MPFIRTKIERDKKGSGSGLKPRGKGFSPIMDSNMRDGKIDRRAKETRNSSCRHIAVKVEEKSLINDMRRSTKAFEGMDARQVTIDQKRLWRCNRQLKRMVTFFRAAFEVNIGIIAMPNKGGMTTDRASGIG